MNRTPLVLTLLAAAALAGCDNSDHTIVAESPDPMANELAAAPPVELPPAIAATKKYRCGSDVVQIDWLEKDGKPAGANVRVADATTPVNLTPGADGNPPFTAADGTKLTGTKTAASVNLTLPGKGALTCKS